MKLGKLVLESQQSVGSLVRVLTCLGFQFRLKLLPVWLASLTLLLPAPGRCASGQLDTSFNASLDGVVHACAVNPGSGKIIVAGAFSHVGAYARQGIAALNSDGSPDSSFYLYPALTGTVKCFAIQPDFKIVFAETIYSSKSGTYSSKVSRLLTNGTTDATFSAANFNGRVNSMCIDTNDGKILVAGDYTTVNGFGPSYISRLTSSGTVDGTFYPNANAPVNVVVVNYPSRTIAIGGQFTWVAGGTHYYFESLSLTGTHNSNFLNSPDPDSYVTAAVAKDLATIVGGSFANVDGLSRLRLARFDYNGGVGDLGSFTPYLPLSPVLALSGDPTNPANLYVGGLFSFTVNGVSYQSIVRYYQDSQDLSFCAGNVNGAVNAIFVQGDGKVLIGGDFSQPHNYIARLLP